MFIRRIFGAAAVALALAATPLQAKDFDVPIAIPPGAMLRLSIVLTEDGVTSTSRYKMSLAPTPDGFVVQMKLEEVTPGAGATAEQRQAILARGAYLSGARFDADRSLTPLRLYGAEDFTTKIMDAMGDAADGLSEADRALAVSMLKTMFGNMTPEAGAQTMLSDVTLAMGAQGRSLDLKRPVTVRGTIASPMGPTPLKANRTFELQRIDSATGRAIITMRETYDPASVRTMVTEVIDSLLKSLGPALGKTEAADLRASLKGMTFDMTVECTHEVDMRTGLMVRAECDQVAISSMPGERPERQVERFVFTQEVIRP